MANKHLFSNGTSKITSVYLSTGEEGTAVPILIDNLFIPLISTRLFKQSI